MPRKTKKLRRFEMEKGPGTPQKHGLYSKLDLTVIDGRTSQGKFIRRLREELRAYVGVPTAASELLISQILYKTVRLSRYEVANLNNPKNEECPHFLPLSNSLRHDLVALAGMAGKPNPPSLDEYIDTRYGK